MEMNNARMRESEPADVIGIPAAAVKQMFFDVHILAKMHKDLIHMYEQESLLKKHHKAYLHIREKADEMCRTDKQKLNMILEHYEHPAEHMDRMICPYNHMKDPDPENAKEQDAFDITSGMVMMSTGTLGVMQDDMLALTMTVDQMIQTLKQVEQTGVYDRRVIDKVIESASELASDVFKRWDDADLAELN